MKKRIISNALVVLLMLVMVPAFTSEAYGLVAGDWTNFRGDETGNAVVNSKTPRDKSETKVLWDDNLSSANYVGGSPLIVGDSLYVATGSELRKYSKSSGTLEQTYALSSLIDYTTRMVYGDGHIYVPVQAGYYGAYKTKIDLVNLSSGQVTTVDRFEGREAISTLTYSNGKLLVGLTDGGGSGSLVCIDTSDGNVIWSYENTSGYYWSGGVIIGNYFVIAGDDSELVTLDLNNVGPITSGIATESLGGQCKSGIVADGNNVYFTTNEPALHKYTVDPQTGTISSGVKQTLSGSNSTNAVVINGDNVYALSGNDGFSGNNTSYLAVADKTTLDIGRTTSWTGYSQSSPLLTTGYASGDYPVYLYLMQNSSSGDLISIKDDGSNLTKSVVYSNGGEYSSDSVIADSNGTLYAVTPNKWKSDYSGLEITGKILALTVGSTNTSPEKNEESVKPDITKTSNVTKTPSKGSNGGTTNDETNLGGLLLLMCSAMIIGAYTFRRYYVK